MLSDFVLISIRLLLERLEVDYFATKGRTLSSAEAPARSSPTASATLASSCIAVTTL